MSDVETIKSFMVKLGFQVDQGSETKFKDSIESATKGVLAMGATMAAAAIAVATATAKMAMDFDRLYFSSQRTGASVGTIKAFGYAVSQLGGTAEGASASLESLARKMRESPGIRQQINSMTGAGLGPDGKISAEQLEKIGDAFRKMQPYMRQKMAAAWGIDENTMLAMVAGVDKFTAAYKAKMKAAGLDPEKAAADGHKFMVAWRGIWATFGNVVDGALSKLMGAEGDSLVAFGAWFDKHSSEISAALGEVANGFLDAFAGWRDGLGKMDWRTIGHDIGEVAKAFGMLVRALTELVVLLVAHPILGGMFGGALAGSRLGPYGALAGAVAGGAAGAYLSDPAGVDAAAGGLGDRVRDAWKKRPKWLGGSGSGSGTEVPPPGARGQYRPVYNAGDKDLSDAVVNTIAGEARLGDPSSVDAVINNMFNRLGTKTYGPSGNLEEVARAPGQYAGYRRATPEQAKMIRDRIRAIASGAVPDITNGANEYRAGWYSGPWGQKHANSPVIGGNRFAYNPGGGRGAYSPYEKPGPGSAVADPARPHMPAAAPVKAAPGALSDEDFNAALRRDFGPGGRWSKAPAPGQQSFNDSSSRSSATLHANTTINISGGADPAAVGAHVDRAQSRQNANLIRNMQGAVA